MKEPDYLWLFFVITGGVATGNLISNWVTARVAAYELERVTADFRQSRHQQTERFKAQAEAQREATRQERVVSPTGKALEQACREWREAQRSTPTYTTQTEAQKHCARYQRYVATGAP